MVGKVAEKKKKYQESAPCSAKLVALSPLHAGKVWDNSFMPRGQHCHRDRHLLGDATPLLVHAKPAQLLLLAPFPPHWEGLRQHLPSSWLTSPPPFTFLGGFLPTLWCGEMGAAGQISQFPKADPMPGSRLPLSMSARDKGFLWKVQGWGKHTNI